MQGFTRVTHPLILMTKATFDWAGTLAALASLASLTSSLAARQ